MTADERLGGARGICDRQGAKLTDLRHRVLELILAADVPPTAYQLLDRLKETRKNAVPTTIYRTLEFLMEHHLVHKVEGLNAFIACAEPGQENSFPAQFLICRTCSRVTEVEDQAVVRALANAAGRAGFQIDRTVVEIEGVCAACLHPA